MRMFRFNNVKYFMDGMFFESREEFFEAIYDIMATIPTKSLYGVYEYQMSFA
jgi:hypothetical protein